MKQYFLAMVLLAGLSGCEQAVLQGPVTGAEVTITDLRSGELAASGELTDDLAAAQARWENFDDFSDFTVLGVLGIIPTLEMPLQADRWYLVSVSGGFDIDSNGDLVPDETPTAVSGPIRALMKGEQLLTGAFTVGALSETAWQWVREHYPMMTDLELAAALDELAQSLVQDIYQPKLGELDYRDLVSWNPLYFSTSFFKGSLAALDDMEEAIASGASDSERLDIAREMTTLAVPAVAADAWFREAVSPDVAQASCISCHVADGIAGQSEHVLVDDSAVDHLQINGAMYASLVESQGVQTILDRAQGIAHQGGVQLTADSEEYLAFETYLNLLDGINQAGELAEDLFANAVLASPEATLRRASLLLAGVLPSEDALASVRSGGDDALRFQLRYLMQGEGFHDFLIESANDRLLTDKWIEDVPFEIFFQPFYPDLTNLAADVAASGDEELIYQWIRGISHGLAREPLELIAHVIENELPYTEILTADYTMVNPQLAVAYRSDVDFADDSNIDQWQMAVTEGYTRIDQSTVYENADDFGAYVSGGLPTVYPHAGVLNTLGWLSRYPSTATDRNRARSRWTWYHFLGFDIERSAPRTTDPEALADTDNPTLKNPNCTVCHEIMDPVAGAYQNYGDDGFYKDQYLGMDSLPELYKRDRDLEEPYAPGDTWYNDMRDPGFDGAQFYNQDNTIQSLALAISEDYRFSTGAVKFWWPALMGEEAVIAPSDPADVDYAEQLALFQAQSAAIEEWGQGFANGFDGGAAFNLKDLLVEMLMSPWFRLDSSSAGENAALRQVGTGKLLTPEQLDRKTEAITGYRWYERESMGVASSQLTDTYRLFYGGIDSDGVTRRATEMTALMSTVVEAQPLQMGCVLVAIEFNLPQGSRNIFTKVERSQHEGNAESALREQFQYMHERFFGEELDTDDAELDQLLALYTETRAERISEGYPTRLNGSDEESCPFQFFDTSQLDTRDPNHVLNTWISILIYYMTDFRYVYE